MQISTQLTVTIAALAVLAGCSDAQSSANVPAFDSAQDKLRGAAEVRGPADPGHSLLYAVSASYPNRVLVYDYPGMSLQQTLNVSAALGLCSDTKGNVFVTVQGDGSDYFGYVYEYAHGGRSPIAVLPELLDRPGTPDGCSVDPTTGNLAVANGDNIAAFTRARGTPTYYSISGLSNVTSCSYDDQGNLAASGIANSTANLALAMLWNGAQQFQTYVIKYNAPTSLGSTIQFDGAQFGISNFTMKSRADLYRVIFKSQYLDFTEQVSLGAGRHGKAHLFAPVSTWIDGSTIIAPYGNNNSWIGFWKYPGGGRVQSYFNTHREDVRAVTVSVPPS